MVKGTEQELEENIPENIASTDNVAKTTKGRLSLLHTLLTMYYCIIIHYTLSVLYYIASTDNVAKTTKGWDIEEVFFGNSVRNSTIVDVCAKFLTK